MHPLEPVNLHESDPVGWSTSCLYVLCVVVALSLFPWWMGAYGPGIVGSFDSRAVDVMGVVWRCLLTWRSLGAASGVGAVSETGEAVGAGDRGTAGATAVRQHAAVDGGSSEASVVRFLPAATGTGSTS